MDASNRLKILASLSVLAVIVSGCGLAAQRELMERRKVDFASKDRALSLCLEHYPENSKEYVAKANCNIEAYRIIRPYFPYPDLFDQEMAYSALMAERLQSGKVTKAEATAQLVENHSRQVAEEQRRNASNRAVAAQERSASAQEDAVTAANRPVFCNRVGNSVSCF